MRTFMTTAKRAVALLALATAGAAVAATATWTVTFEGPGGHSNGNYGNVNAVHAGARAVMELARTAPDAVIAGMKGGNSVNSIASDCTFTVTAAGDERAIAAAKSAVDAAVQKAVKAENDFRGVKAGDTVRGAPAEIRATVK